MVQRQCSQTLGWFTSQRLIQDRKKIFTLFNIWRLAPYTIFTFTYFSKIVQYRGAASPLHMYKFSDSLLGPFQPCLGARGLHNPFGLE